MFIVEKNIPNIALVSLNLAQQEHKEETYRAISPMAQVPALELPDGRVLTETRAICTYLEGLYPDINLMGETVEERAFIEMADRRAEWSLLLGIMHWVRHTHPGMAAMEPQQFTEFGHLQSQKVRETAQWYDGLLQRQEWIAGDRFTIADITAFSAIEFARVVKFRPANEGLAALQAWRDRIAERSSAQVTGRV
jgi:glutathione S-transferase